MVTQTLGAQADDPRARKGWVAAELVLLAAIWGLAYLFFRISVRDFGPVPVAWLRLSLATAFLLPGVLWRRQGVYLLRHWRALVLVGACNFALPFVFYAYALQTLDAGLASILNASAPLSTTLIAWIWLRERLTATRLAGLVVGFAGVLLLTWDHVGPTGAAHGNGPPVLVGFALCVGATVLYGYAASYTRRYLSAVPAPAIAAGSLLASTLLLAPAGIAQWPASTPPLPAWLCVLVLGIVCTAWAFATYFRLLARLGPSRTMATTYLTPAFGMAWGWMWLDEPVTGTMLLACGVILLGTALGSGALRGRRAI
jgi:drug/metabolite transporter (DMT)-like permease